ncbi:hypothetical protein SAMN05443661_10452 [Natronobacterium gregoryi]|uniref:Halobacterial output domain-containing protein n=3 Tax=Natronobacterium gregoryi TaxID=44930 RepID=L0AK65_NATGS|nr:hypothetical protein Natgr_2274 [Natronobacterium gregoryi SP2]ELY68647.1 hypothetical protein C490_09523 [Natronobacterium gregoryi SP2]PLK20480.1 hypothetical protein CYV19_09405 [Natronobacterium gregoryi SP2]SFI71653.1 hypothetical protein SAMN05443661_10452 [Natronobacterium gregoryi]
MAIIDYVARRTDTDPVELEPLYDAIDPDALDALAASDAFTSLEFEYADRTIEVETADGEFHVSFAEVGVTADEQRTTVDTGSSPSL